ncbi:hypothetical protein [Streptomyces sp. NBC_01264]|uniref:hypothetical protein n=1 Tax=Streptomyces sp. NBC_01264 TaxID=2903804 RepID=UPI00224EC264|nr:hypothetical protein [Streptomyces sp. NBC_01264]MCX4779775.1 hypothetical protein [Streptomyces sp. NBC_01264]
MTTSTNEADGAEADAGADARHGKAQPALAALGWSVALAAAVVALGYASYRWAATGLPLEPLPGSPWPYLAAFGVLCLACCLLLRWATGFKGVDGGAEAIAALSCAGIRTSLAHRPDLALLWTYGALAVALITVAAIVWRLRHRS